jgi:hypothetical protein
MKNLTICFVLLLATPVLNAQQWVSLFNGKDLEGWTNNGTEKWWAEKGELICESGPNKQYGYLSTNKHYKNFVLSLEFRQEANGNSGVFFRSSIEGVKISGWQAEVAPPNQHTGGIYESYGRGWLILPKPEDEKVLKYGEWNKYVIRVNGDSVSTWLNGHLMISLKDEIMGKGEGFIALQIHEGGGIRVRWRDIRIQELK